MLLDVLAKVERDVDDRAARAALRSLDTHLQREYRSARRTLNSQTDLLPGARDLLRGAQREARGWQFADDEWSLLSSALTRIVRNARRAGRTARGARSDDNLHEWRKQVKHLDYALTMLRDLRPGRLGALGDDAHLLAALLGDDHDLAVLVQRMSRGSAHDRRIASVERLIDERRAELQDRAFTIGERLLHACKPKAFVSVLEEDWRRWRK